MQKRQTGTPEPQRPRPPTNPLRLASLAFLLVGLWMFGSSLYSRRVIAPALEKAAKDPAQWDEARRRIDAATWLVFGRGIFASRLNRRGEVLDLISKRTLADAAAEYAAALADEQKTAETLALTADASTAAKYGPGCVEYVARLAALRSKGEGPSDGEAVVEIMRYVEAHARGDLRERYGGEAAELLLTYRGAEVAGQLTEENRETLNNRWRELVEKEIDDYRRLVLINGRNGYVFSGFLFLASAVFLLISMFARAIIPQEPLPQDAGGDTGREK